MSRSDPAALPDVAVVTMRGGATPQNATYHLLNVLSELTAVSLITVTLTSDSKIHGEYDVTEIASGTKGSTLFHTAVQFLANQFRLCRAIWAADSSTVYFFGGAAYALPVVFARLVGKRVIVQPRGDVPLTLELEWKERYPAPVAEALGTLVRALEFASYAVADRIVTYTESMATELGLSRFEEKLYTQGTRYVDVERFRPSIPHEDRDRRVGMIGRLDVEKGIEELTEAVKLLPDDVEFVFVGDGARRDWVERELAADIETGRVEVTGWVDHDEIPTYLNRIQLLVMASAPTEGLPTAIQEAFACGTPVYAPPVSGIRDVLIEGETGSVMDDRRPERIAADVERLLDGGDLPAMSERCREFAVERYSFDASVERFRRLLAED